VSPEKRGCGTPVGFCERKVSPQGQPASRGIPGGRQLCECPPEIMHLFFIYLI
jgi:hypothetical protein